MDHNIDPLAVFTLIVSIFSLFFAALQALFAWLYLHAVKKVGLATYAEPTPLPANKSQGMRKYHMKKACTV